MARGLGDLGHAVNQLCFVGGPTGRLVRQAIQTRGRSVCVEIGGETRVNLTLFDPETGREIHSVAPGPNVGADDWSRLRTAFESLAAECDLVVLAGSQPPGLSPDAFAELIAMAHQRGARVLVDSSGAALGAAVRARPWAIKPNREELAELIGGPLSDLQSVVEAARSIVGAGVALVAVTLGADGAILVSSRETWHAAAPVVPVVSTVGCGDAFAAGLLHAVDANLALCDQLRWAVAAGSANASVPLPGAVPDYVRELVSRVDVRCLKDP